MGFAGRLGVDKERARGVCQMEGDIPEGVSKRKSGCIENVVVAKVSSTSEW